MIARMLSILHKEVRGLHEAAYLLALFAALSTILALIRDRILAGTFGAGEILDVYYAAFRIPDIIFIGIASAVSVFVLVPFLSDTKDTVYARRIVNSVLTVFGFSIMAVSIVVYILTPIFLNVLFPDLASGNLSAEFVTLTRMLLLQPILLGFSGILASITQTHARYMLYALTPILYNIGIIIGILFFYPIFGVIGLGYGVVLGALLHAGIQFPFVFGTGVLSFNVRAIDWHVIKRIVSISLPRTVALFVNHLAFLVLLVFAAPLGAGAVAVFSLAFNLQAAPLAVIGASYSTAAFPTLSRLFGNGDREAFLAQITSATRHILFWSFPVIALFVVLRAQIVRTVLGSGEFDWSDTRLTAAVAALFVISLAAQGLSLLFVRGYYAAGNTIKPLIVNTGTALLAVGSAFVLLRLYEHSALWHAFVESVFRVVDVPNTSVLMLALAYSVAAIVNALIYGILFARDFARFWPLLSRSVYESAASAFTIGTVAYIALELLDDVFDINTFWGIFLQGFLAGIAGIAVGILVLLFLRNKEIQEVWKALHNKVFKATVMGTSDTDI